ncbi:FG-GAP repeat protein [Myxosarcina sp. GI1]|uniref:FG-GAP repeat protein n=1 Tax=Myxosarcina sp. GI1 TaxID=1541065 RepID=UPI000564F299|nr:FG-GAP repeat protein [Myxosarcina sp. GI1]
MANSLFNLGAIDGSNGFVIKGTEDYSVSTASNAGDINDDGIDDFIVSAFFDDTASKSYVVFGDRKIGNNGSFEPSALDGSNGFVINSIEEGDRFGASVSNAGDVNGDGIDDLIIGAPSAEGGKSYVIFGGSNVGTNGSFELSSLDGSNGFVVEGINSGDYSGSSVSGAGDVNSDGFGDLIIGAPGAAGIPSDAPYNYEKNGESYVVFGGSQISNDGKIELSSLDGNNGFIIKGIDGSNQFSYEGDRFGASVSSARDLNGDGFDDIVIGAPGSFDAYNRSGGYGETYVIFGDSEVGSSGSVDLGSLESGNGFLIDDTSDLFLGVSVSDAGDVNGDGFDDIVIGAAYNILQRGAYLSAKGLGYVIFGDNEAGENGKINPNALNGSDGFILESSEEGDLLGQSVSNAGDVNGDGFDDLIIGAPRAGGYYYTNEYGYTYNYPRPGAGASFIIFGNSQIGNGGTISVDDLDGNNGVALEGINNADFSGFSVKEAGDINNDGIDDLIIDAPFADPNGVDLAGETYVVFGNDAPQLDLNGEEAGIDFTITFTNNPVLLIDSTNLLITDSNSNTLSQATVVLTNPLNSKNEFLAADTSDTDITAEYDAVTDTLSLTGEDSIANYLQVLDTLTYNNTAKALDTSNRTVEITLDDGAAFNNTSAVATTTITFDTTLNNSNDAIDGRDGKDTLLGRSGNDVLRGNGGDDLLDGGRGKDMLDGGIGDDSLIGGTDADEFVLRKGEGTDTIFDFQVGKDSLVLGDGLKFKQLQIGTSNGDTVISIIDTDEPLASLMGIRAADITSDSSSTTKLF